MRGWITLAIVGVIVLVLGGSLLICISSVREAAAAMQCSNNLKQIGMAVGNYYDDHGHYPSATVASQTLAPDRRLSWLPDILPYAEGMGGRLLLDPEKAWDETPNRETLIERSDKDGRADTQAARVTPFGPSPLFFCSANTDRRRAGLPPFTHYVGIGGVGANAAAASDQHAGFFGHDRVTRRADVKDGLNNTILVAETSTSNGPWTAGGYPTVRGPDPDNPPHIGRGAPFCSWHGDRYRDSVRVVMGDGSVRSMARILPQVFESLCTINGDDPLPAEW